MIFFRSHLIDFKFQRGGKNFLLFGNLKAYYSAPVHELSGMTVNLKDVDRWMSQASSSAPVFQNSTDALKFYFKTLQKLSQAFHKVEVSIKGVSSIYDGNIILKTYKLHSWFQEGRTWVQRPLLIQSTHGLSKKWRAKLAKKKWTSQDVLISRIQDLLPGLCSVEVLYPKQSYTERYSFQ